MSTTNKRYLRSDQLLPGDVFLSRGTDRDSNWIAWATFGPFSHAAIYWDIGCLFESNDDGVGFTGLNIEKAYRNPGKESFLLLDVSQYHKLEIRRHPKLQQECATPEGLRRIKDELGMSLIPQHGFEYPALTTLARAVPNVPSFVVLPILWTVAQLQREPPKVVPGMFCSQLVATVLEELGAYPQKKGYFGRKVPSNQMSPNHFRSHRSLLASVQDATVGENYSCESDYATNDFLREMSNLQSQHLQEFNKSSAQSRLIASHRIQQLYVEINALIEKRKRAQK